MPLLRRAKPPASSSPDSVISTPPTSTPWDPPPALPPSAETEVVHRGGIGALRSRALRRCCASASATAAASSSSSVGESQATIVGAVPPHCEKASVSASSDGPVVGASKSARVVAALDGLDTPPGKRIGTQLVTTAATQSPLARRRGGRFAGAPRRNHLEAPRGACGRSCGPRANAVLPWREPQRAPTRSASRTTQHPSASPNARCQRRCRLELCSPQA